MRARWKKVEEGSAEWGDEFSNYDGRPMTLREVFGRGRAQVFELEEGVQGRYKQGILTMFGLREVETRRARSREL